LSLRTSSSRRRSQLGAGTPDGKCMNSHEARQMAHMLHRSFTPEAPCELQRPGHSPNKETAMNKTLIAAAAALIPLAGLAAEGSKTPATPAGQSGSFDTLDANKDGRISMPEASADASLVEAFSSADKNGDGYLDNAEFDDRTEPQK
jgi:hypothetical protein